MKKETKNKLMEAWAYCNENDKSTAFMMQYMQDVAGVDHDYVLNFLEVTTSTDRTAYFESIKKEETFIMDHPKKMKESELLPPHYVRKSEPLYKGRGEHNVPEMEDIIADQQKVIHQLRVMQTSILNKFNIEIII